MQGLRRPPTQWRISTCSMLKFRKARKAVVVHECCTTSNVSRGVSGTVSLLPLHTSTNPDGLSTWMNIGAKMAEMTKCKG